jgi:hypothetical protein
VKGKVIVIISLVASYIKTIEVIAVNVIKTDQQRNKRHIIVEYAPLCDLGDSSAELPLLTLLRRLLASLLKTLLSLFLL